MMKTLPLQEDIGSLDSLEELDQARWRRRQVRRLPYDYVAKFRLTGRRGNIVPAAINVSAEARFICTSIGYSLEEPPEPPTAGPVILLSLTRFARGFDPRSLATNFAAAAGGTAAATIDEALTTEQLAYFQIQNLRESLSFKYAIIDKGSGRELQNEAIHNLAGLGKPDGIRPFRELVVPYVFAPNSTIVIELHELVTVTDGIVHMDFQGYKEFR
jgi:hypothetical protein